MFLVFCFAFPPFHAFFSNLFLRFPTVFQEFPSCNFLIFPAVSSIFLGFSKLAIYFFLHFHVFSTFSSIFLHFCNPSPLLPRHHSSSPCKPSCSEPQRTLLSVEVRILSFFNMLASMFLVFCFAFPPFHAFFSNLFLRFPTVFQEFPSCNFLIFPTVSSIFLGFSKLAIYFFLHFHVFFNIFLNFPPFFATLRHSFLGITPRPLANRLAPNPNGRCSPLRFGSLVSSICLPLCS